MRHEKPFIIGLAGGSGSGKTTLARIMVEELPWNVAVVPLDRFYRDLSHLSREERLKFNFDVPEALLMDDAFTALHSLAQGYATNIPHYDFDSCLPLTEKERVVPTDIILFEGMHALYHQPLLSIFDLSIFLDIGEQTRFERKLDRDMRERNRTYENVLQMWNDFTKPMHDVYIQPCAVRADMRFTHTAVPEAIRAITETVQHRMALRENTYAIMPQ